ncbi:MAG: hypothetical protein KF760_27215 [Candidatus Eremiobacteraeota bacterium]|nr:hypothetical protein [Candidatus Eremiobacteraeota bacterium]MCW5871967.1 hypothetical protein [Candidatus Eremiobacteraeota bacterium]
MLEEVYTRAREHPWYRDRFLSDGSLPVLSKAELYEMLQGRERDPFFALDTYWSPSGGSGATAPLYFPTAVAENLEQRAVFSEWLRREGILGPATVALSLFSSRTMYRSGEIFVDYVQRCGGTVLPAGYQARDADVRELHQRFGPNTLMGSPGRLVQLAHAYELPFERVLYASEFLTPGAQALLQARLGVAWWSSVMGSAEGGVWGFSRFQDALDVFWAPRSLVLLEIEEADEEGFGRVIVSNCVRRRHPLLRYDSGDRGRLLPGFCDEVVGLQLAGRHGRSFQFSCQYYDLSEFASVLREAAAFQFVLRFEQRDWLTLRLVGGDPDRALAELRRIVRFNPLANRVEVELCEPGDLRRVEHSGKILPIVDLR